MKKTINTLDPKYFILRYYNPSPGNPVVKNMNFDNNYIYVIWTDGKQTKTPIKNIENKYQNNELEGVTIWLTSNINIFLEKYNENDLENFDED